MVHILCGRRRFEENIPQYERTGNDEPPVFRLSRQRHRRVAVLGTDKRSKHLSAKPPPRQDLPGASPSRPVVDHDLDRPEMQARRRVQFTGTNQPCGLAVFTDTGNHRRDGGFHQHALRCSPVSVPYVIFRLRSVFRWPSRESNTRSHSEHGSEGSLRRGYCGGCPWESSAPPELFFCKIG